MKPTPITARQLIQQYEMLLLDAYGVLMHHTAPLAGAARFVEHLNRQQVPYQIVTNDAARLPATTAARLQELGLAVPAARVISSGSLLPRYFAEHDLAGQRCVVLGTEDSCSLVRQAGGQLVPAGEEAPVLVLCDELGYDFVEGMDRCISGLVARLDRGLPVVLLAPNPDIIYPKGEHQLGFTAGAMALMVEAALQVRYPGARGLNFIRLGKPNAPIFEEARRRARGRRAVMLGDQLGTDIEGANRFGLPSVLVTSGLSSLEDCAARQIWPTHVMESLKLD